jgi:hypothetical protein
VRREKYSGQRLEFLRKLLDKIASDHNSISAEVQSAQSTLKKVKTLAEKRNTIAHGTPRRDPATKKLLIELNTGAVDCDLIDALTTEAQRLYKELDTACFLVFIEFYDIIMKGINQKHP